MSKDAVLACDFKDHELNLNIIDLHPKELRTFFTRKVNRLKKSLNICYLHKIKNQNEITFPQSSP